MKVFSDFVPSVSGGLPTINTWINLGGGVLQKKEGYLPLHEVYNYSLLSTPNYGSNKLTKLKLPVTSRINPQ